MKNKRKSKMSLHRFSTIFTSIIVSTILLTISGYLVFERVSLKNSLSRLNIVDSYNLVGSNLEFNDSVVNLKNPLLKIRKYDSITNKFYGSNITELIGVLSTNSLYLSKSVNYLVYEVMDSNFISFNSNKIKVRFSDLGDGYLLEVNNKTDEVYYVNYNSDCSITVSPSVEGLNKDNLIHIKSGLNQIKLPSSLDLKVLCKNLISAIG